MSRPSLLAWSLALPAACVAGLAAAAPPRPPIVGISHVSFRVSHLARAQAFYEQFLGLPTALRHAEGEPATALVTVNQRQSIELRAGLQLDQDRLDHVALETSDVDALRGYLEARGVALSATTRDAAGHRVFTLRDADGHALELAQHTRSEASGAPPSTALAPISRRILHAGILVGDLDAAGDVYAGLLGFREIWRGSRSGDTLSWTNMQAPEGGDYVEFMLYGELPAPDARGSQHHVCLEVPDIEAARAALEARPYRASYGRPLEVRVGTNRKRQLNLFDPDGTRVELMEPDTVDGLPAPSSTAPPPRRR
jgi:lactoylglutathione lyase